MHTKNLDEALAFVMKNYVNMNQYLIAFLSTHESLSLKGRKLILEVSQAVLSKQFV